MYAYLGSVQSATDNRAELNALEEKANKLLIEMNKIWKPGPVPPEYAAKKAELDAVSVRIYGLLEVATEYTIEDYKAIDRHVTSLSSKLWGYQGSDRAIKEKEVQKAWDLYYKIRKALKIYDKTGLKEVVQTIVITSPLWLGTSVAALSAKNRKVAAGAAGAAVGIVVGVPMLTLAFIAGLTPIAIGIPVMIAASYGAGKVVGR